MKNQFLTFYQTSWIFGLLSAFLFQPLASAQTSNWESISIPTQGKLWEVDYLKGIGFAAIGDSGKAFLQVENGWTVLQAQTDKALITTEFLNFTPSVGKVFVVSQSNEVFALKMDSAELVSDSLPGFSIPPVSISRLTNLNITNSAEFRYGLPSDSGRLVAYKTEWNPPIFNFKFGTQKEITDLYPFNAWNILAIGDSGKIWRTLGLDNSFQKITHNLTSNRLNRIFGYGNNLIWIAGDHGTLLFSQNGGSLWTSVDIPTDENLNFGSATDSTVWVCGNNGQILSSTNFGETWQVENSGITQNLFGIKAFGNEVFACGSGGKLIRLNRLTSNHTKQKSVQPWVSQWQSGVQINFGTTFTGEVCIYGCDGKMIESKNIVNSSYTEVKNLNTGIYFMRISGINTPPVFSKISVGF